MGWFLPEKKAPWRIQENGDGRFMVQRRHVGPDYAWYETVDSCGSQADAEELITREKRRATVVRSVDVW